MSFIDLTQLSTEDRRKLEKLVVPPLSKERASFLHGQVMEALNFGDLTADLVRFGTEGLIHVCVGLLNPIMNPNNDTPDPVE